MLDYGAPPPPWNPPRCPVASGSLVKCNVSSCSHGTGVSVRQQQQYESDVENVALLVLAFFSHDPLVAQKQSPATLGIWRNRQPCMSMQS